MVYSHETLESMEKTKDSPEKCTGNIAIEFVITTAAINDVEMIEYVSSFLF